MKGSMMGLEPEVVDWQWVAKYPKAAAALIDVLRAQVAQLKAAQALAATQVQPGAQPQPTTP